MNESRWIWKFMKKDSLLKSSIWVSMSGFLSRVLSVIYIIPWNIWIGAASVGVANALYARVYNIYNLFLIIATAGIPSAISREVAANNSIGDFSESERLLKKYSLYMTIIGIVLFILMFFGSNYVALIFAAGDYRVSTPIKYLSVAMLIIPALGILRGYIQGYAFISSSAFSQVIEQIVRVAYMLYTTYIIMVVNKGSYKDAVNQSTFASFIGALSAFAFLMFVRYRIKKNNDFSTNFKKNSLENETNRNKVSFWGMLKSAVPFLLVDTIMVVLQLFDQTSFTLIYKYLLGADTKTIDDLYSMFGFQANKIIMVLVSIAISISATIIPTLSAAISAKKGQDKIQALLGKIIEFTVFLIVPASMGMIAISSQLWTVFVSHSILGSKILSVSVFEALFYCIFLILENILQVLKLGKTAMLYLFIAYLIKVIIQTPLTLSCGVFGPLLASTLSFFVMSLFCYRKLKKRFELSRVVNSKRIYKIIMNGAIMMAGVSIIDFGLSRFMNDNYKIVSVVIICISVICGIIIFGFLSYFDHTLSIIKKIKNTDVY